MLDTRKLLESGVKSISNATFIANDIVITIDFLIKNGNEWEMYDVKPTLGIKNAHFNDTALKILISSWNNINIKKANCIYINSKYCKDEEIDIYDFFEIEDITQKTIKRVSFVKEKIKKIRSYLKTPKQKPIGNYCFKPRDCSFKELCWEKQSDDSIFNLTKMPLEDKFELYFNGVKNFRSIPKNYHLSKTQLMQIEAEYEQKEFIDIGWIKEFLSMLEGDLYFLDFESWQPLIPPYKGTRAFSQIPFLFSLHKLDLKGELTHFQYFEKSGNDSRENIAKKLCKIIGGNYTVIAFNSQFETKVIEDLAEFLPEFKDKLLDLSKNIIDISKPFKELKYYSYKMKGKKSIKSVLPAIVDKLNYNQLEISNGEMASMTYSKLHYEKDLNKLEKKEEELLEYCKLDTLAMVEIYKKFLTIVKDRT